MADIGPPPPIAQESIAVQRTVDPSSGQVITSYFDQSGREVLRPTYSLQGANAGFIPAPTVVTPHAEATKPKGKKAGKKRT